MCFLHEADTAKNNKNEDDGSRKVVKWNKWNKWNKCLYNIGEDNYPI